MLSYDRLKVQETHKKYETCIKRRSQMVGAKADGENYGRNSKIARYLQHLLIRCQWIIENRHDNHSNFWMIARARSENGFGSTEMYSIQGIYGCLRSRCVWHNTKPKWMSLHRDWAGSLVCVRCTNNHRIAGKRLKYEEESKILFDLVVCSLFRATTIQKF